VKEFVIYTLARLGLFVASYAVVAGIWLLATGGSRIPIFLPLLIAMVISAIASVYLLKGPRHRFALRVDDRAQRMATKIEESRSKEDVD
jgi:hypothetical protein